jgi:hypothetical protein
MTPSSDDLNDLTSDITHLKTLIRLVTDLVIDIIDPGKEQCEQTKKEVSQASDLLWIARDMVEQIASNAEACHQKVLGARKEGGQGL